MAATNSRYDHPVYMDRVLIGGSVGASAGVRFAAYTDMLVKSVNIKPTTAGTTAAQVFALKKVLAVLNLKLVFQSPVLDRTAKARAASPARP